MDPYSGHNQQLREIRFSEMPQKARRGWRTYITHGMEGTIDDFIQRQRFKDDLWWIESPPIREDTSRSSLLKNLGAGSYRRIYWPRTGASGHKPEQNIPHLSQIRISVAFDSQHNERAIELLAVDKNGQWQPFYYTQEDGRWTPEKNFLFN